MRLTCAIAAASLALTSVFGPMAEAIGAEATFLWTRDALGAAITGQATATAQQGAWAATLTAAPVGAVLNGNNTAGLGIDSSAVAGGTANDASGTASVARVNLLGGPSGVAGMQEGVSFSFNRGGFIRDLLFDGIKDETLEFFTLTLPGGGEVTFFDGEVEFRLNQQGFDLSDITEPNVTPLVDGNDDKLGLNLPFAAGDTFTLTYGEFAYPAGYAPIGGEQPNGARWEGMVVVPEPMTILLGLAAATWLTVSRVMCTRHDPLATPLSRALDYRVMRFGRING